MNPSDQRPRLRTRNARFPLLLTVTALLAAGAAHAQPRGVVATPGRPFQELDTRVARVESDLRAVRELVGTLEKMLTPLEGLERCVRVFEGELGGLPGPHILFTRCNVHVRSGELATDAPTNGLGNLVVGYNEGRCFALDEPGGVPSPDPRFPAACLSDGECGGGRCLFGDRQGSHNLIVGQQHEYGSYAGVVAGRANAVLAPQSTVTAGYFNEARAAFSAVHGGIGNLASGEASTIASGRRNLVLGTAAAVLAGEANLASGETAAVVAGRSNEAEGVGSVVVAGGSASSSGGARNVTRSPFSAILGGLGNTTATLAGSNRPALAATISGGAFNLAGGEASSVSGGQDNQARGVVSTVGGGWQRVAPDSFDWRAGGLFQDE
jgi:hypothetical protein